MYCVINFILLFSSHHYGKYINTTHFYSSDLFTINQLIFFTIAGRMDRFETHEEWFDGSGDDLIISSNSSSENIRQHVHV